jgi:NADPH-dependent 2,4-dienoyl-CoA reductase/sulfur reductase-like enzyme
MKRNEQEDVMENYPYVIVGGGLGGGKAVEGIRERDKKGRIALVTAEPHRPYHRPPLSKDYMRGEQSKEEVYVAEADYYADHGITLLTATEVTGIDPEAHTLTLEGDHVDASKGEMKYDKLLLATGGRPIRLDLPGINMDNVFTLRVIEDSARIRAAAGPGKDGLILGGSFIGSEVAASLTMIGTNITMAFPESRLLEKVVPEEMSKWLHMIYASRGIRILPGITAERFFGGAAVQRVELSNGAMPTLDLVVMGVGIKLNTQLAQDSELEIRDNDKAVLVNQHLQTSNPDIYAAGDIASWPAETFGKRLRVEHWDVARSQGLQAGRNMAGAGEPYTTLPYFFSDLFDLSFEVWGDLSSWDETVRRGELETRNFAFYYFHEGKLNGVLAMGRPENEREPMQELVRARPAYEDVAKSLRDDSVSLSELVGS